MNLFLVEIYRQFVFVVFKLCSFQHGNCKKGAELVGEGKVDVGQRGERPRGSSLWKICGGCGQGDKIKRDRLGGGGFHDKQVCICPSKYI